jgi:hypothetical protein
MTMVTESERLALHQAMRGIIGAGPADTFMELATPRDWDQVVRTHHLTLAVDDMRSEFRLDLAELRAELKHDINDLRVELKHDINDLRTELKQDIADLRVEIVDRISAEIQSLSRWIIGVLSTLSVALIVATVR